MSRPRVVLLLCSIALLACSSDPGGTGGETETGTTGIPTLGTGDGDPGDGDPGDGDPGDGDPGDGDPGDGDPGGNDWVCGDGVLEGLEQCDDGNTVSGDGCSSICTIEGDEVPIPCGSQTYECGDTIDNDGDGLVDGDDFECTSPCDDDEATFNTELPGQNLDCIGDCYWDSDSGGGNDKCEWNLKCDPGNPGAGTMCEYDPNFQMCDPQQVQECLDLCVPAIPNGCDCFGCCEVGGQLIYLGNGDCALDNLDACETCTFNEECGNPCEPELCELCFGQDPSELPEECGPMPACPMGLDSCVSNEDCVEDGFYCQTGCCIPIQIE